MGLATDLVNFFDILTYTKELRKAGKEIPSTLQPRTLGEFFRTHDYDYRLLGEAASVCRRLIDAGVLAAAGSGQGSPPLSECYWNTGVRPQQIAFPLFEFLAYGFPAVHEYFSSAVRAVIVEKVDGDLDIGTCFLLANRTIVTARHCVENMNSVIITGWSSQTAPLRAIHVYENQNIDLAILSFSADPLPDAPGFPLDAPNILDNVLTMGYPQIQGFDAPLIAETSQIAAVVKSSIGIVVSQAESYLDGQDYLLISARVKGGNSGGPVIGRKGGVVGVVTHFPAENYGRPDLLGYAAAIPSMVITDLLKEATQGSNLVSNMSFQTIDSGFHTKQQLSNVGHILA